MAAVLSFRRPRSPAAVETLNRYVPTTQTILCIIHKNIKDLRCIPTDIENFMDRGFENDRWLAMDLRELLRHEDRAIFQIVLLYELADKFALDPTSTTKIITNLLEHLYRLGDLASQTEEKLRRYGRIKQSEIPYLDFKSEVVHSIEVLEKVYREISLGQLSLSGANPRGGVDESYHPIHPRSKSRGLSEILHPQAKESCWHLKGYKPRSNAQGINRADPGSLNKQTYLCVTNGFRIFCLDLEENKDQTLNNACDVPLIPRIATLDLRGESLPTIGGLFKWRSNAYMIGGHKTSESSEENSMGRDRCSYCSVLESSEEYFVGQDRCSYCSVEEDSCCYEYCTHTIKGTSCLTYGLSLSDDATLSHFELKNIWNPKKPKCWPIVEEINGQIHVIDSVPHLFDDRCGGWLVSHEVFNLDNGTWAEEIIISETVSCISENMYTGRMWNRPYISENLHTGRMENRLCVESSKYCIKSYLVLGDRIYAASNGSFLVFDSIDKRWEEHPVGFCKWCKDLGVRDPDLRPGPCWCVGRFLRHGPCRCVGKYPYVEDPIDQYVVLALEENQYQWDTDYDSYVRPVGVVAYLVTSMGQILHIQRLARFFKGPLWPVFMSGGSIIQDDDEVEGNTVCSIVKGGILGGDRSQENLFINTFTVEMLSDAAPIIRECLAGECEPWQMLPSYLEQQGLDLPTASTPMIEEILERAGGGRVAQLQPSYTEQPDFVRVHSKDSYIYRMDDYFMLDNPEWAGMQACFV